MKSYLDFLNENNLDYVNRNKSKLSPSVREKIRKQQELGVDQELIDRYKQGKIKERENRLRKRFIRDTIKTDEYEKIYESNGIQFFMKKDDKMLNSPTMFNIKKQLANNVAYLNTFRDILPIKKPKVIISEIESKSDKTTIMAYYYDRIIYLDPYRLNSPKYLVHEYAHYIADLIPKQTEQLLLNEYEKFMDSYFKVMKKRRPEDLTGHQHEKLRKSISKKLGLPSSYAFSNPDELFAEIIMMWKEIPNNRITYKFKQAMKKVLTRL